MKKFNTILAIAAVAMSSVFGLTSCDKENDPINVPEESQYIKAVLSYSYTEDALEMFDVNYEITNFDGKVETFTVKEAGYQEKEFNSKDMNQTAKVKTNITVKTPYSPKAKDQYVFKLFSKVNAYVMEGEGIAHTLSIKNDIVLSKEITFDYTPETFTDEIIQTLKDTYTYNLETVITK